MFDSISWFLKPNILDFKLGTVLSASAASLHQVACMEKSARNTMSFETGIRLTGFQVSYSRLFFISSKYLFSYPPSFLISGTQQLALHFQKLLGVR